VDWRYGTAKSKGKLLETVHEEEMGQMASFNTYRTLKEKF
jgi:hypothetical protein